MIIRKIIKTGKEIDKKENDKKRFSHPVGKPVSWGWLSTKHSVLSTRHHLICDTYNIIVVKMPSFQDLPVLSGDTWYVLVRRNADEGRQMAYSTT